MIIYFVRHGEVENPKDILYSRLPGFPLSKIGRKRIKISAKWLKDRNIKAIYSSPMLRARQSAEIVAKNLDIPRVKINKLITEVNHSLAGKITIKKADKILYYAPRYIKRGTESEKAIYKRMKQFIDLIVQKHPHENIIAVSHADPMTLLALGLQNYPLKFSKLKKMAVWEKFFPAKGAVLSLKFAKSKFISLNLWPACSAMQA